MRGGCLSGPVFDSVELGGRSTERNSSFDNGLTFIGDVREDAETVRDEVTLLELSTSVLFVFSTK